MFLSSRPTAKWRRIGVLSCPSSIRLPCDSRASANGKVENSSRTPTPRHVEQPHRGLDPPGEDRRRRARPRRVELAHGRDGNQPQRSREWKAGETLSLLCGSFVSFESFVVNSFLAGDGCHRRWCSTQ